MLRTLWARFAPGYCQTSSPPTEATVTSTTSLVCVGVRAGYPRILTFHLQFTPLLPTAKRFAPSSSVLLTHKKMRACVCVCGRANTRSRTSAQGCSVAAGGKLRSSDFFSRIGCSLFPLTLSLPPTPNLSLSCCFFVFCEPCDLNTRVCVCARVLRLESWRFSAPCKQYALAHFISLDSTIQRGTSLQHQHQHNALLHRTHSRITVTEVW